MKEEAGRGSYTIGEWRMRTWRERRGRVWGGDGG